MAPRVLVTGGTGFVGRHFITHALASGWQVTSLALPGEAVPAELQDRIEQVAGDITDPATIPEIGGAFSAVVHLAAPVGVAGEYQRQWHVMTEGTRLACALAARCNSRLVVTSSIAVYGSLIQTQICREDDGFGPWQGAYGRAKQAQETVAIESALRDQVPLTIIRPANVYGLGGTSAWGDRLLSLIRETGGAVVGAADRHNAGLTHVENLSAAIFAAMTRTDAIGRTYNVCDGLAVTWRRFMDDMAALVDRPPPPSLALAPLMSMARNNEDPENCIPPRDPDLPFLEALNLVGFDNRIDASRIRRELGWQPGIGYEAAFAKMKLQLG